MSGNPSTALISEFCERIGITESQFDGSESVGGDLYLGSLTSIPDGFNPTVGGSLYLGGLTSIPDGFNPTVGGSLDLRGLHIETRDAPAVIMWQSGRYCSADGIFAEVICKRMNDDHAIWKLRKVSGKVVYMAEQGDHVAHGETVRDALMDLRFKAEDRDASDYEGLTADSEMTLEDAAICYRVITGACRLGVQDFLKNRLVVTKGKYKVSEIIELTKDEYGAERLFAFFNAKRG